MKENTYKTLGDLAQYLNGTEYFSKKWISVKKIIEVFTKAKLFTTDNEGKVIPTEYMKNSGGCFTTKSGKILFTEPLFKAMTENNKYYSRRAWLDWFIFTMNTDDTKKIKNYLVFFDNKKIMLSRGTDSEQVRTRCSIRYPKLEIAAIKKINIK